MYPLTTARDAFVAELDALGALLDTLDDDALHARSRCRGWLVSDVLAHLHLGLIEMVCGFPMRTNAPSDVDVATYWTVPLPDADQPGWAHVRFARALSSTYARPTGLVGHMRPVLTALRRIATELHEPYRIEFQGHVIEVSDFVATWVVETVVHHLDVTVELDGLPAPPPSSLAVGRDTVAALLPEPERVDAPGWDDVTLLLAGTGRIPLDDGARAALGASAAAFPVLGQVPPHHVVVGRGWRP